MSFSCQCLHFSAQLTACSSARFLRWLSYYSGLKIIRLRLFESHNINKVQSHWFSSPRRRRGNKSICFKSETERRASLTVSFPILSSHTFSCWATAGGHAMHVFMMDYATLCVGSSLWGLQHSQYLQPYFLRTQSFVYTWHSGPDSRNMSLDKWTVYKVM